MESQRTVGFKSRFFELKHFDFTEKEIDDAIDDLRKIATSFEGLRNGKVSPETLEFIDKIESEEFRNLIIQCICYPSLITLDAYEIRMLLKDADKTLLVETNSLKNLELKIKRTKNIKDCYGVIIYIACAPDINLTELSDIGHHISPHIYKDGEIAIGARITKLPEGKRKFYALLCWGKLGAK